MIEHWRRYDDELFIVACDFCIEGIEIEASDWQEMILKKGWKIFKNNEEWKHKCPTCTENRRP